MKKKNYLDVLMDFSRFSELRYRRSFTEFMTKDFVAEAASVCRAVKNKYGISGESLAMDKALDICFGKDIYIDTEPENSHGRKESWFCRAEDGTFVLWINPDLSAKEGQDLLVTGLATFLLPNYHDLYYDGEDFQSISDLVENPPLLKAVIVAEVLTAMLLANESDEELLLLEQSSTNVETVYR